MTNAPLRRGIDYSEGCPILGILLQGYFQIHQDDSCDLAILYPYP